MKISEAIKVLGDILKNEGDLELATLDDVGDNFKIDTGRTLEVISFEHAYGHETTVCALMPPVDDLVSHTLRKNHLTLVPNSGE